MENKRKHHIVPRCYLKNFAADDGNIWTYRLDNPHEPFSTKYENVGHIRDYYAQPKPDGTTDHNLLENFFDESVESNWSSLLELVANKECLTPDQVGDFLMFVMLQRIRVPATRDMIEIWLAYTIKTQAKLLGSQGEFEPPPTAISVDGKVDWDKIEKLALQQYRRGKLSRIAVHNEFKLISPYLSQALPSETISTAITRVETAAKAYDALN